MTHCAPQGLFLIKDASAIKKYWAPDFIQHDPALLDGNAPLLEIAKVDLNVEVGLAISPGDYFIIHTCATGLRQILNLDAEAVVILCGIHRIEDGLIRRCWNLWQEEVPASETVSGNSMQTLPFSGVGATLSPK